MSILQTSNGLKGYKYVVNYILTLFFQYLLLYAELVTDALFLQTLQQTFSNQSFFMFLSHIYV